MSESSFTHAPVVIAAPAQAFYHLVLTPGEDRYRLSFSVKDETNIRYYLIEGSHDMVSFDPLSRIYAKGARDLPRTYNATIHNTGYGYYRIRQVDTSNAAIFSADMNADMLEGRNAAAKQDADQCVEPRSRMALAYA